MKIWRNGDVAVEQTIHVVSKVRAILVLLSVPKRYGYCLDYFFSIIHYSGQLRNVCLQALLRGETQQLTHLRTSLEAGLAAALAEIERLSAADEVNPHREARDR
jgi:sensor domain CHASE-containing protein